MTEPLPFLLVHTSPSNDRVNIARDYFQNSFKFRF